MIVFVSYNFSHDAQLFKTAFKLLLNKLRIALRGHFPDVVLYDFDDNKIAGQDWQKDLGGHIEASEAVVSFVSPSWAMSKVCREEFAIAERIGKPLVLVGYEPMDPDIVETLEYEHDKKILLAVFNYIDQDNWLPVTRERLHSAREMDSEIASMAKEIADAVNTRLQPVLRPGTKQGKKSDSDTAVDPVRRQAILAESLNIPISIKRRILTREESFQLIPPGMHTVFNEEQLRHGRVPLQHPFYMSANALQPKEWLDGDVKSYRAFVAAIRKRARSGSGVFLPNEDQLEYALIGGGTVADFAQHPWGLQTQSRVPEWTRNAFGPRMFGGRGTANRSRQTPPPSYSFVLKPMHPTVFSREERSDSDPPGNARVRLCLPVGNIR